MDIIERGHKKIMHPDLLTRIPLFKTLPEAELAYLANTLNVREYAPGEVIFMEGQVGDRFCVILEGEVEAVKALASADERILGVRTAGQFIGELSLINRDHTRTATVRALSQVRVLEMTLDEFDALLVRRPTLAYEVVRVVGERLIESETATIHDLREKNERLAQMYTELQAAQAQIIEKEKLDHELQVACQIQMSILPRQLPIVSGYDFAARMLPARVVGGDFYDAFPLKQGKIGLMIGDVADKGMPSAIYMARTHALLFAELSRSFSPVAVLRRVNRYLMELSSAPLFVTVLLGVLDISSGEFHYGRAGHELPILALGEDKFERATWTDGQMLGIFDDPLIDEQRVIIPPGGMLFLYTDGVVDERNPQLTQFGIDGLLQCLKIASIRPANEICSAMIHEIAAFQHGMAQDDDITMLVVKRE